MRRRTAFTLEKASSMGERSGEYAGRNSTYGSYLLSSTQDSSKQASSLSFLSPVKTSANRCTRTQCLILDALCQPLDDCRCLTKGSARLHRIARCLIHPPQRRL